MQFDLIKEVLTGSITGYITNSIAIKMIFREYGVGSLKLGGVIIKTREEFIDNISTLVERDIINPETLKEELSKESFKNSIVDFADDFLNQSIYENTSNLKLRELNGFNSTIDKTDNYMKICLNQHLPNIFDDICKNIYLKDILNKKQGKYISDQLFKSILHILNNSDFIEENVKDFYNENKNINFGEFFGNKLSDVVIKNLEDILKNLHIDLKNNFDKDMDAVFENTLKTLEINKILSSLEEKLLEKSIIDLVANADNIKFSKGLIDKIKDFTVSDNGKRLINNFSKELHNLLKSIDKPVLELLSDDLKSNVESFFKDKLQYAIKEIILWIEKNKEDIEGLIEKAIDDTISSIDDGMKKNVLGLVRDKFLNDVAKKFDIVSKITDYLEQNADIDSISKDITLIIIKYLREEKISDIIYKLEKNKVFTAESLSNAINYNIANYIDYLPEDYFSSLLNKKVGDIFSISLVKFFENHIKYPVLDLLKHKYIYTEKATKTITEELIKNVKNIDTLNLGELVSDDLLSSNYDAIKKLVIKNLHSNESNIIKSISTELEKSIGSLSLYDSLKGNLRDTLLKDFIEEISNKIELLLKNSSNIDLKLFLDTINSLDNIKSEATNFTLSTLKKNLPYILNGTIKKSVSSNLRDLKDEELQTMIEEFMGKEMKPITVIGALLGAIVGIGMYFFDNSVTQYNYLTATLISVAVYAFVGLLTNVQALEMLFKPYYEKRILGVKIPFTPGVIVSRKPRFAKSMSTFVDEELLKKNSMEELFNKNADIILNSIKNTISKDNYKLVVDFFNNHSEAIADKSFKYVKNSIYTNKDQIATSLSKQTKTLALSKVDFSKVKNRLEEDILLRIKNSNQSIYAALDNLLKEDIEVFKIIPENFKTLIKKQITDKIEKEINNVVTGINNKDKRNELLLMLSTKYEDIENKSVKELLDQDNIIKYQEYIKNIISSKITSEDTRLKLLNWIEGIASKETSNDKKLGQLFGGFFVKIIENNFSYIMDNTIKAILTGLTANQKVISEVAITTTKESLNFIELMGYNMLGGDDIVSSVINNLINDKFPAFIESKKDELNTVLENFINNKICNSTIGNLNLSLQQGQVLEVINKFVNDEKNVQRLDHMTVKITDSLFNWITDVKLKEFFDILSINKPEDLVNIFEDEIDFTAKEFITNIIEKRETLSLKYTNLIFSVFESMILSNKISTFTNGIDKAYVESLSDRLSELIYGSISIKNGTSEFINLLDKDLKEKTLEDLLDLDELNNCLSYSIEKILENVDWNKDTKSVLESIVTDIISKKLDIIDDASKEAIVKIILTSVLDSASRNFSNIISSVDFRGITENQIKAMSPKEIEDLFNSFAKKYFNKLKLYGLGGAIFGLHWIVGVAAFILYAGNSIKSKLKQ